MRNFLPLLLALLATPVFATQFLDSNSKVLGQANKIKCGASTTCTIAGGLATLDAVATYTNTSASLTFDHSVGAKTVQIRQNGSTVTLHIPAVAIADGLGTVAASTAIATAFRPSAAVTFPVLVIDNGTTRKVGQVVVASTGVLTFSVLGTAFTNAAAAGWDAVAVTYSIP